MPSIRTKHFDDMCYWFNEFQWDRTSVFDEECPGCAIEVITEEMV